MALSRGTGVALWRQIAAKLEQEISGRRFPPGGRLPTEYELAVRFNVNRHTLRRAVSALEEQGLVRIEQGRGTFVQGGAVDYAVGKRTRFSENLLRQARAPSGQLIRGERVRADALVARELGLRKDASVILIETVRRADDTPISFTTHYFPAKRFPRLIECFDESGSISAALSEAGVEDYWRKSTRVTSRLPDEREIGLLEMPRTRPLLVCEAVNVDQYGEPIEFGCACFCADRVQLSLETS